MYIYSATRATTRTSKNPLMQPMLSSALRQLNSSSTSSIVLIATIESPRIPQRGINCAGWRGVIMSSSVQVFLRSLESTSGSEPAEGETWHQTFWEQATPCFPFAWHAGDTARCVVKIWTATSRLARLRRRTFLFSSSRRSRFQRVLLLAWWDFRKLFITYQVIIYTIL